MPTSSPDSERPSAGRWSEYLRSVLALVSKDLRVEWRSREQLGAMIIFALLSLLVFNFALELQAPLRMELSAGILWVTLAFAGTLGLNRSLGMEQERGCMDGLLLTPVDRTVIYFGKAAANFVFMLLVAAALIPLFGLLYGVSLARPGLILVVLLGTIGYASVGTLLATMSVQTRTRDMLLPILLFPVILPVLIAAVKASSGYLQALPEPAIMPWINLLIAYDVIFVAVAMMLYDSVVQD